MTRPTVYVAPLTIAETAWLIAAAGREQKRLIRWDRRHSLADALIPKLQAALDEAVAPPSVTENQATARAEYSTLGEAARAGVDLRWSEMPEHVKDDIRAQAEWDLL